MNPDQTTPEPVQQTQPASQPPMPLPSPAATPTPGPMPATQPVVGRKKFGKKPLLIALLVAVLVVAGAAYAAYAYVTNTPEYVFKRATEQLGNDSLFASKFSITNGTSSNGVTISGDVAFRADSDNPKNAEAVIGFGTGNSRITTTVGLFDDALFFKFGNLGNIGNLAKAYGMDSTGSYSSPEVMAVLKNIDEKWFTVSKEELQGLAKLAPGGSSITGTFSTDDFKKVKDIYDQHSFVVPDKIFADEVVDGKSSAHFTVKQDNAKYVEFLTALKAANLKSFQVTDEEISKAKTDPGNSDGVTVDVWVARDSKKIKQLRVANTNAGSEMTVTLTILTDLPKLEKLQKPTNAKPFTDLMTLMFGPGFQPTEFSPSMMQ